MKHIIYSNYDLSDMYDDCKEFLMEERPDLCDVEVADAESGEITYEPSDNTVWEEIYFTDEIYFEEAFRELKNFFNGKKVIFFGSLGLWTGRHNAGKIGDFEKLFYEAIKDCDYIEFADENGHLILRCSHHDGTNEFEIKVLTDKGYDYSENWAYTYSKKYDYDEQEMHNRIIRTSFLSRLPHYWEKVYA